MVIKLILAFLGGLLPVLVWLWFFEREDEHPEPRRMIFLSLLAGMAGVVIVVPFEKVVSENINDSRLVIFLWAAIEEIIKFFVAYVAVLRSRENNEPIDSILYLIMVALGFAALENALFIYDPLFSGSPLSAIVTGDFRFIGATLLHVAASGIIGVSLALSWNKSRVDKSLNVAIGLVLAIILHTLFNLFIMVLDEGKSIISFYLVWIVIIILLLLFEKVKQISKQSQ